MKYVTPLYEMESIEAEDIMSVSVNQDGDKTDVEMDSDNIFGRIANALGL